MNLKALGEKRVTQSRFAFTQSSNKKNHIYHSLLTNLISLDNSQENILEALKEGDKSIAELVNRGSEKGLEELIQNGFIVSPGVNEPSKLREHFKEKLKVDFGMMYLLVTDSCNLRCKYCFVENPLPLNHKFSLMSPELAKRGIDLFVDNITQNKDVRKNVCIYGGEPLLNRETVHETISHIRKNHKDKELNIQLITNGTLMTPETARILSEGNVDVAVSIDGPEEITNFIRPMTSKEDTYQKIKSAWKTLRNAGHKNLSISLTLTSSNVPNLKSNIEKLVEEFKPNGFGFNFLLGNPCDLNGCSINMDYTTDQVIETFKYLRNVGIPEDRMMRKVKAFVKKSPHLKDCGGIGNQIVVSSDGYVGPCHAFASSKKYFRPIGDLENKDLRKDKIFQEWGSRYPLNTEDCYDCKAIGVCGGGCPYQSYLTDGDIKKLDTRMCEHNTKVLDWIIQETIENDTKIKIPNSKS